MGEVYRARDPALKREVAIKVLPSFVSQDPDRLRRFEQEAQATAALNHPNILAVYRFGVFEGAPYLVSELLEGSTLRQLLRTRPHAGSQSDRLRRSDRAWTGGRARKRHRSSRPEAREPVCHQRRPHQDSGLRPCEADAAPTGLDGAEPTLTAGTDPGVVMGTAGYMSPEQVRASRPTIAPTSSPSAQSCTRCSPASARSSDRHRPRR